MGKRSVSSRASWLFLLLALLLLPLPTAAQNGAGEIDNCCYVDRECTTDFDWVSGYWAFQNKECAVSSQPRQPAATEEIDNCCFIDWLCRADEEWVSGYYAFQHNYCAAPSQWQGLWSQMWQQQRLVKNENPQRHNGNQQQDPEQPLPTYSFTVTGNEPNDRTEKADDGTPLYISANDPSYMCYLNPGSHWCDQ